MKIKTKFYEVEDIVDRQFKGNKIEYLVKWKNYTEKTWEPFENLNDLSYDFEEFNK